jgi:hypothetical protein
MINADAIGEHLDFHFSVHRFFALPERYFSVRRFSAHIDFLLYRSCGVGLPQIFVSLHHHPFDPVQICGSLLCHSFGLPQIFVLLHHHPFDPVQICGSLLCHPFGLPQIFAFLHLRLAGLQHRLLGLSNL